MIRPSTCCSARSGVWFAAALTLGIGCGPPPPECGTGTILDDEAQECVLDEGEPEPEVSVTPVPTVDHDRVQISDIDLPNTLSIGTTPSVGFTVTLADDQPAQSALLVRVALALDAAQEYLANYQTHLIDDGVGCSDTCGFNADGTCDDGASGAATAECGPGTDCSDCGVRGPQWACVDGACFDGEYCDGATQMCHPDLLTVGFAYVTDVEPGTTKTVSLDVALPVNFETTGTMTWVILAGEEPLNQGRDGVELHPDRGLPVVGQSPVHRSMGFYVHDTVVELVAGDVALSGQVTLDNFALELDDAAAPVRPRVTATLALSSMSLPVKQNVHIEAHLALPGHVIDLSTYDASNPIATYDADRQVPLLGTADFVSSEAQPVVIPHGSQKHVTLPLYLARADSVRLAETLRLRTENPDLNANDEIDGHVVLTVTLADGQNVAFDAPITFLPPEPVAAAADTDSALPEESGAVPAAGPYAQDVATPPLFVRVGDDRAGATVSSLLAMTEARENGAVVAQRGQSEHTASISLLGETYDIGRAEAVGDFGTQRDVDDDVLSLSVFVPAAGELAADLQNTVVALDFDSTSDCDVTGERTRCQVWPDETPAFDVDGQHVPVLAGAETLFAVTTTTTQTHCVDNACFGVDFEVDSSVRLSGALATSKSGDSETRSAGVLLDLGVAVAATVRADGALFLAASAHAIEGELTVLDTATSHTWEAGFTQRADSDNGCWQENTGRADVRGDVDWRAATGELVGRDWSYLLFAPSDGERLWREDALYRPAESPAFSGALFQSLRDFSTGPERCESGVGTQIFHSPVDCTTVAGAPTYCGQSAGRAPYTQRFYFGADPSDTEVRVSGRTELLYDVGEGGNVTRGDAVALTLGPDAADVGGNVIVPVLQSDCPQNAVCEAQTAPPTFTLSGELGRSRLRFEVPASANVRYVDVALKADGTLSAGEVTLEAVYDGEGAAAVRSGPGSLVTSGETPDAFHTLDYAGPRGEAPSILGPIDETEFSVGAVTTYLPFDDGDVDATSWIWGPGTTVDEVRTDEAVSIRQVIVPESDLYVADMWCTGTCQLFVDDAPVASHSGIDGVRRMTIAVTPRMPTVLSIEADHESGEPGVAFMMKVAAPATGACGQFPDGAILYPGESISSSGCAGMNGEFVTLSHEMDGNVIVVADDGTGTKTTLFSSATTGVSTTALVMQPDGDMVLLDDAGTEAFSSGTAGNAGAHLQLSATAARIEWGPDVLWVDGGPP